MPSYEHNKLIQQISDADTPPKDSTEYAEWLKAGKHLELLQSNAKENELIVYALDEYTLIHTAIVNENSIRSIEKADLLNWNGNAFSARASYAWEGGRDDVWIERDTGVELCNSLKNAQQLVFARHFEGFDRANAISYEILQEYSHVTEIYWRPEHSAYCRFDKNGDIEHSVSITPKDDKEGVTLVSFRRPQLEEYLAASKAVLVRMFDFTLLRRGEDFEFTRWPDGPEDLRTVDDEFLYRQKVDPGKAAYTRGIQIIRPGRTKDELFATIRGDGDSDGQGVEFVAYDWRNRAIRRISTDPGSTTNYFQASGNSLPYETSPVFFRPDVLLKYKGDREKYTVSEELRSIQCRSSWQLRSYDVNEAGQVHAYICDLANLPYQEQVYWKSFNERPKSGISKRAFVNDFEGQWSDIVSPLEQIIFVLGRWSGSALHWWRCSDDTLFTRVNTPWSSSREEWAEAFVGLCKLVIEGLQVPSIRKRLEASGITFEKEEKSLKLIERFLVGHDALADEERLVGLRTVQHIRSKLGAHYGGRAARDLADGALREHGSYTAHFESVCLQVVDELEVIEKAFV